jgi:hypothetical protein
MRFFCPGKIVSASRYSGGSVPPGFERDAHLAGFGGLAINMNDIAVGIHPKADFGPLIRWTGAGDKGSFAQAKLLPERPGGGKQTRRHSHANSAKLEQAIDSMLKIAIRRVSIAAPCVVFGD